MFAARPIGTFAYPSQVTLAAVMIITVVGFSSAVGIAEDLHDCASHVASGEIDHISLYEQRFRLLRPLLPRRGVVGYVSDRLEDEDAWYRGWYLTQYALAPVIVVRGTNQPLIVGNFHAAIGRDWFEAQRVALVKDLGQGVLLLRPQDP